VRRISVVGSTGSGKTTFAKDLSERLGAPCIELDAIRHQPGWVELPDEQFRERVAERIAADAWVVDGNYGGAGIRPMVWARADTVIWLDTSLLVILARLFRRTTGRILRREELWNGNRETFRNSFLSRQSLFIWAFRTYWRRRRLMPEWLALYPHLRLVRLRSANEARRWLDGLDERSTISRSSAGRASEGR